MKVAFVSNYYNHHQAELCHNLSLLTENEFIFIELEPMSSERQKLGWKNNSIPTFVLSGYSSDAHYQMCRELFTNAEIGIWGDAPYKFVKDRLKSGKLTYRYSERLYKNKTKFLQFPIRVLKNYREMTRYNNLLLLAASAYATWDYSLSGTFVNKSFKWGYFPPCKKCNIGQLINSKIKNQIIWVGRLIDWKHPEMMIDLASRIKSTNINCKILMIGSGKLEKKIRDEIQKKELTKYVKLLGSMTSEMVREYMEKSALFIATSDYNEGWGAVINEAMNSGCVVIASHAMGSVPFLIENGINGFVFESGNRDELFEKVLKSIVNFEIQKEIGEKAYNTIVNKWNAAVAAKNLIQLSKAIQENRSIRFENAPCDVAELRNNGWYRNENI